MAFNWNDKKRAANEVITGPAQHTALKGGSRSGKTALFIRNIFIRAQKAPGSRHAIFRFRFNHCVEKIGMQTIPFVLENCFPNLKGLEPDRSRWFYKLPNASEIWLGGLDDKERTEKILGGEFVTSFLHQCSEIAWNSDRK